MAARAVTACKWSGCVLGALLTACSAPPPRLIRHGHAVEDIHWNDQEAAAPSSIRPLRRTNEASHHYLRLATSEAPHVHAQHDLTCVLLKGCAVLHLEGARYELRPGDVMDIPRGTVHWAEVPSGGSCEVYVIFSPALDAPDTVPVEWMPARR